MRLENSNSKNLVFRFIFDVDTLKPKSMAQDDEDWDTFNDPWGQGCSWLAGISQSSLCSDLGLREHNDKW